MAKLLRQRQLSLAELATEEMGKLTREAIGEVEKCALACDYYADNAAAMLADETIESNAQHSFVSCEPLGTVLAIMPWNFPLWQVFRFLAPTLMTGNTALLKHAPSVPRCALAIEQLVHDAGLPEGVFSTLLISVDQTASVLADDRVQGVSFTGSDAAGRKVATIAGQNLKKVVLELGGSDPFVVLDDADLGLAVNVAIRSRFGNAGQTCVAAKRFILVEAIADTFVAQLTRQAAKFSVGDPKDDNTGMAPMAREDLRTKLHSQVQKTLEQGASVLLGCELPTGNGFYYPPSIIDGVEPGMEAFDNEVFGPVIAIVRAKDEAEALTLANQTRYGLGASVWTQDRARGERFARKLEAGVCFVNALVASDIRLPFGGVKASGLGRELSSYGIREFCNIKTIYTD
jgi:succinate-semialdehyde dehydrogenase/glutarate-semialdehyde dehydrogenase